jgi:hypothetical protein
MKKNSYTVRFTFFIALLCGAIHADQPPSQSQWAYLFSKTFSDEQMAENNDKSQLYFAKEDVPLFSQLIFSWNSFRLRKGFYSFYVAARDAQSGKWGEWHRMADWGANIQRSYLSNADHISHYHFVRLEIHTRGLSDAFRIKIVPNEGARLNQIKSMAVSTANLNDFKAETIDQEMMQLPSVHVRNVPMIAQFALEHPNNDAICSPTSCSMLTGFLSQKPVDPIEFAAKAYDQGLGVFGSWPFNMAYAFEVCDGSHRFYTARLNSFARIHARLKAGMPVVVSVRGPLEGAEKPYKNGHLLVVVGYDAKKREVIAHDPAFKTDRETERRYPLKSFLQAWERSRRLAYVAEEIHQS